MHIRPATLNIISPQLSSQLILKQTLLGSTLVNKLCHLVSYHRIFGGQALQHWSYACTHGQLAKGQSLEQGIHFTCTWNYVYKEVLGKYMTVGIGGVQIPVGLGRALGQCLHYYEPRFLRGTKRSKLPTYVWQSLSMISLAYLNNDLLCRNRLLLYDKVLTH